MKRFIPCLIAVAIMAVSFPVGAEVTDRIVAIVNDDIVTLREVERYVVVEKKSRYASMKEYLTSIAVREKIDSFIDNLLISQQARKLKIEVGEKEIQGAVEGIKKQNLISDAELKEQLKREGINYDDFVDGIKSTIVRNRVLARVMSQDVAVDERRLREYYSSHAGDFVQEEYRLQHIFVSGQKEDGARLARSAVALLDEGKTFDEVTREFSDEPSKDQGGDIGFVKKEELIPELREAIRLLTPGTYTRVVQTPYGFHILKLAEVKKGDAVPFEEVREKIAETLFQIESERRYKEYMEKLKSSAYIEVKI
jgi:peptidyl-prolyl cis-trans isomerase SurA